ACSASSAVNISGSQNIPGQVLVLHDVGQHLRDVPLIDHDDLLNQVGTLEGNLVEQFFHHGMQPPCSDVFGAVVDLGGEVGDAIDGAGSERQLDPFSLHQRHVLFDERAARLGENPDELFLA